MCHFCHHAELSSAKNEVFERAAFCSTKVRLLTVLPRAIRLRELFSEAELQVGQGIRLVPSHFGHKTRENFKGKIPRVFGLQWNTMSHLRPLNKQTLALNNGLPPRSESGHWGKRSVIPDHPIFCFAVAAVNILRVGASRALATASAVAIIYI